MGKLTKEQIKDIDGFLVRHRVKFIDVRLELIDHLASEYEAQIQEEKLHAFLMRKRNFINDFVKNRQKKIHWSSQKQLLQQILKMFYKSKFISYNILIIGFIFSVYVLDNSILIKCAFIVSMVIPMAITLYKQFKSRKLKYIQSFQSVAGLMSLPSVFLYSSSQVIRYFSFESFWFYVYWFVTLIFGFSGLIVFNRLLNQTQANYNKIKACS